MTTMTVQIADDVIRDRSANSPARERLHLQRPSHQRTARALRGLADRLDRRS